MNFSTAGVARDKKDKAEGSAGTDEKDDKLADTGPQPPKGLDTDMDMDDDGELEAGMEEGEDQKGLTNQAEDDKQQDSLYGKVLMQRDCILISALAKVMGVMIITSSHVAFHAKRVYEDCAMGIERVSVTFATLLALDEGAGLEGSNNKNGPETQGEACRLQLIVSCSKIRQVMPRLFLLQDTALEVFFKNHTSCFINFPFNAKDRNDIYGMLTRLLKLPHELSASRRLIHSGIVSQWQRKEMSNFQYLMHINTLAGRSYNDVSQYPVFPWVLQDYTSKSIDLTDSKFYRDLTKPMGMINPSRCEIFEERYENPLPDVPPFHYGSHYSSPAVVNYFLVRVEPYSTLARTQQGGRFDLADRLFDSVERAWNLSYSQSSDVKELIPEFFSNPAFLRNVNGLDLGTKQNGKPVGDVELPPWSKGKPEEFIRIHREALESEYVSANLHLWIDLIFGHRQQGKGAEEAKNLFYYLTYPGQVDLSVIDDQKVLEATLAQISSFGQTPRQLWTSPHPPQANKLMPSKLCLPIELPPLYEGISFCNVGGEAQIGGIAVDPKGKVMIMTTDLVARVLDISTMLQALTEVAIQLSGDVKLAGMLACATVGPTAHLLDLPKSSLRYNKGSVKRASVLTRKSRTSSKGSVFSEKSGIKTPFSVGSIFGSKRSKKGEEEEGELIPFKGPFKLDCPEWLIETISPPLSLPKPTPGGSRSRPRTESNRTAVPTLQEEESELEETPESKLQSNTENPGIIRETENSQLKTPSPENLGPVGHVSRSQRPNKPHKREARRLIALSSNARFAFIGGYEDKCFRCYMCDGKVRPLMLSQVSYHRAKVTSLRLAPSQAALVTGDETGQVCLWNTAVKSHQWRRSPISLEPIANFRVHDGRVIDCALHLKAGVCISVGLCHALGPSTNCVAVYSTYLNRCVRLLFPPKGYTALRSDMIAGRRGPVYFIVYVEPIEKEDARKAEEEGMLVLYSATGDLIAKRSMGGVVTAMETTPKGAYIACGMQSGELVFVRSSDLSVVQALNPDHQTFEPTYDTQTSNLSSPRNKMGGLSNSPTRTPRGPSIAPPPIPRPFSATLGPTDGNSANPSATTQMTKSDNLIVMSDVPSNAATGISNPIISATESKQGDLEEEPRPQESGALSPTSFIRESRESLFNDSHGALGAVTSLSFVDNEQFVIASYSGGLIRLLLLPQSELLPGFDFFASAAQQIKPALGECIREGRNRKVSVPIEPDSNPDQGPVKTQPGRLKTPTPKAGIRSSISGMVRGFGSLFSRKKQ
uniref:BEACH domain-containing protein n=1 Tax=Amorphochlora amoebiformis TaxID=1561963 RepID=A0A7S0GW54_9EUKA|mmetsp:Transcript_2318/g.3310  ORF Transcript_2318/g.3310 Transcript_2318/m.3310 type:complete len:1273 (+) Transcript_2318:3-3821(+)